MIAVDVDGLADAEHVVVDVAEVDEVLLLDELRVAARDLVEQLALRQRVAAQDVDVALEMQQLVEMRGRRRSAKIAVLQVVDAFLDLLEQREVRVDHLVDDGVEQKVGTAPRMRRSPGRRLQTSSIALIGRGAR